jgi:hypothetical protein
LCRRSPATFVAVAITLAAFAITLFVACHPYGRCYCPSCPRRRPLCCSPATLVAVAVAIALATLTTTLLFIARYLVAVAITHIIAIIHHVEILKCYNSGIVVSKPKSDQKNKKRIFLSHPLKRGGRFLKYCLSVTVSSLGSGGAPPLPLPSLLFICSATPTTQLMTL